MQAWKNVSGRVLYASMMLASLALLSLVLHHSAHSRPKVVTGSMTAKGLRLSSHDQNHDATEAIYRKSHAAAMKHLTKHPGDWGTSNLWFLLAPFHTCPVQERMGTPIDGGKWICNTALSHTADLQHQAGMPPSCHVFSLGSNGEVSFETEFHGRYPHCVIHTFDHTLSEGTARKVGAMPGVTFHPQGIATNAQLAISSAQPAEGGSQFTSINASMEQLGIEWLDILKIDIEGAEWGVFLEMLESDMPMPFTQILMEIHVMTSVPVGLTTAALLQKFFTGMQTAGYRTFAVEPNYHPDAAPRCCFEYAFIKVDSEGHVIRPLNGTA